MSLSNDFVTVGDIAKINGNPTSYRVTSTSNDTILIGSIENSNGGLILNFDSRNQRWISKDIINPINITFVSKGDRQLVDTSHRRTRKGFPRQYMIDVDLYILNRLGEIYHGLYEIHVGYQNDTENETEAKWYQDYGADVQGDEDEFYIDVNEEFIQNIQPLLNQPIPFQTVVLMLDDVIEFIDPRDQERFPNAELIQSRPYIEVDMDNNTVILWAKEKGSDLTIEDILFGSKGLMVDVYRTIDGYKIKSMDENMLVLELDIDNWST